MQYMANTVLDKLAIDNNNFIGIFLYGSQNYGLNSDISDEDAIILVRDSKKASQECVLPTGLVKIYTIDNFIHRLKIGDLECYEILYTRFCYINPTYKAYFSEFVTAFSACMSYSRIKNSLRSKLFEHLYSILWLPTTMEKAKYNKKRLYWAIRVCNQLQRICDGESFADSLLYKSSIAYDVMQIKTITDYLSLKDFNFVYKYLVNYAEATPEYVSAVTADEEICLSAFYSKISSYYKH